MWMAVGRWQRERDEARVLVAASYWAYGTLCMAMYVQQKHPFSTSFLRTKIPVSAIEEQRRLNKT